MQMMAHPVSAEELMAYLDGEMPAAEREGVAVHLEGCRVCQEAAGEFRNVSSHLREWGVDAGRDEMTKMLLEALSAQQVSEKRRGWGGIWSLRPALMWGALAMAALVTVVAVRWPAAENKQVRKAKSVSAFMRDAAEPVRAENASAPVATMIVRTANLTVTTADFDAARAAMDKTLSQFGGHMAEMAFSSAPGEARSFIASLRIPAEQLDTAMVALRKLGHVDSETQRAEEVTRRYVDIDARLNNSRRTEDRLLAILKTQTGKLSDVLGVEEQLDKVRGAIETTEAEQKQLQNQIALAEVSLKVTEEYKPQLSGSEWSLAAQTRNAGINGFRTAAHGFVVVGLWLLEAGPSFALIALVWFFPGRMLWRRATRHKVGS